VVKLDWNIPLGGRLREACRCSGGARRRRRPGLAIALMTFLLVAVGSGACTSSLAEARAFEKKGDLEGAVAFYGSILAKSPKDLGALNGLAFDLLQLKRYDEALRVQETIVALDPKDALTRVELAFNYLNHHEQPAEAVQYLTQAVALEPSAKNLTFLAQAQIEAGDPAGAEASLQTALKTDPKYPHTYVVFLSFLDSRDRTGEAAVLRERARLNGVDLTQAGGG
jgi:tetratricopeptide (TPR) repeat protein